MKKLLFLILPVILFAGCATSETQYGGRSSDDISSDFELEEYMTMEACNEETGHCVDVSAETNGQEILEIEFPESGSYQMISSECSENHCWGIDETGTSWEFTY